jgi:hypothetical protein
MMVGCPISGGPARNAADAAFDVLVLPETGRMGDRSMNEQQHYEFVTLDLQRPAGP